MKKVFFCFLLFSNLINGQSGTVIYEAIPLQMDVSNKKTSEDATTDAEVKNMIQKMNKGNFNTTLIFNKEKSYFYIPNDLNQSELEMGEKLNRILMKYSPTYYVVKDTATYTLKEDFIVKNKSTQEWTISNQTKKIDNFICYKATKIEKFKTRKNEDAEITITAWFCADIPYSYGPIMYNGLPGLILELEFKGYKYVAKKIILSPENTTIELPSKNIISQEEYSKKIKENFQF
ncbi:GLPGLI family protein [Flavobacterium sp. HXWNR29]|uniref:GLPGLI family protein n=1 Tax=Flavobacterium odoriferum TaxID=2946604 RepID=UPI0021CB8948|nr:GLPGLI family protein [Flavobacterium sp. HXWNR29]MCU4187950.1 GLPGLI family protein [Flavobacterium sp. HXWNR29]